MNLAPLRIGNLEYVHVVLLFGDILDASEHENVLLEDHQRMTSSGLKHYKIIKNYLRSVLAFYAFPLLIG